MKKFLLRVERGVVRVLLSPELRPLERDLAARAARSVALRVGLSSAAVAGLLELIDRVLL